MKTIHYSKAVKNCNTLNSFWVNLRSLKSPKLLRFVCLEIVSYFWANILWNIYFLNCPRIARPQKNGVMTMSLPCKRISHVKSPHVASRVLLIPFDWITMWRWSTIRRYICHYPIPGFKQIRTCRVILVAASVISSKLIGPPKDECELPGIYLAIYGVLTRMGSPLIRNTASRAWRMNFIEV